MSIDQLLAIGLTYHEIAGLVAQGFLHRLFRGVYAVGHRNIGQWGWLKAASLVRAASSFLSHHTSTAALGLRPINTKRLEITVVSGRTRSRERLIIHRTCKPPHKEDLTTRNGILISSVPRMFVEIARTEKAKGLEDLITRAARKELLDINAIERALQRHAGTPGIAKLKSAFARYRPGPDRKSGLERAWDRALDLNPDIPRPLKNRTVDGWELDNFWPQYGLDVELDGRPYHVAVRDIEKDKFRDAKLLTRRGIVTLRFTDFRIDWDLAGCLDDVRAIIRRGRLLPAAS